MKIPLHTETTGGDTGRKISSMLRYMTTTWLIFMSICTDIHSCESNTARRCCATSRAHVILPDGVLSFPSVISVVTLVLAVAPSLIRMQRDVLDGRCQAAHTGSRSNVRVRARCRCRQAFPRVWCRDPLCL